MKTLAMLFLVVFLFVVAGVSNADADFYVIPVAKKNYAPVEKTGQTAVFFPDDDGDLQKGVTWPTPRFSDNGDGTVTDNLTGLIWLKDANCFGANIWSDAVDYAAALYDGCQSCGGTGNDCGLSDGSTPGEWRLPNVKELQSLIDFGQYHPALPSGHPFTSVRKDYYWSSTTHTYHAGYAWSVSMSWGSVNREDKDCVYHLPYYVWPVRGGN